MTSAVRLDPASGLVRGVRAAVLTAPAVGAGVVAHASVDGCVPIVGVLLAAGLCWPAAVALLRRQARVVGVFAWLCGAQLATHVLLTWLCNDVASGSEPSAWAELLGMSPAMLARHGVALIGTAALLSRADAGLWTARALIRAASKMHRFLLAARTSRSFAPPPRLPAATPQQPAPQGLCRGVRLQTRRGPPGSLAF